MDIDLKKTLLQKQLARNTEASPDCVPRNPLPKKPATALLGQLPPHQRQQLPAPRNTYRSREAAAYC